jgi:hypothetical protein
MFAMIRISATAVALALMAAHAFAQGSMDALPGAEMLPEGVVQLSPTVPGMGEHWGNPADMPLGPIYCVHEGKIVCLEFMIAQEAFAAGESWPDLSGMEGLPPVDHVSIGFEPQGHEGYEVPHYDIHMYFLPPEEIAAIQP